MENIEFAEKMKRRVYFWILKLIRFIETLPKSDPVCKVIIDQLLRSGTSIGANYVEAIACGTKKGFAQMVEYSLKSGNESKFWLALLRDSNKGSKAELKWLLDELIEITKIFGSSLSTMRNKNNKIIK